MSFLSTEGTIDVKTWLKANRLTKLWSKFKEDELLIEDIIEYAQDEDTFELYCKEELDLNASMDIFRFKKAINEQRKKMGLKELICNKNSINNNTNNSSKVQIKAVILSPEESSQLDLLDNEYINFIQYEKEFKLLLLTLKKNSKLCLKDINTKFKNLKLLLEKRYEKLKLEVQNIEKNKVNILTKQLTDIIKYKNCLKQTRNRADKLLYNANIERIDRKSTIITTSKDTLSQKIDSRPHCSPYITTIWDDKREKEFISNYGIIFGSNKATPPVLSQSIVECGYAEVKWALNDVYKQYCIEEEQPNAFIISHRKEFLEEEKEQKDEWHNSELIVSKYEYQIDDLEFNTNYLVKVKCISNTLRNKCKNNSDSLWSDYSNIISIKTKDSPLDTQILTGKLIDEFVTMMKNKKNKELKYTLLFRGSKDGFSASTFHSKCNNKGATVTIIKSKEYNHIFGGYTNASWCSANYGHYSHDPLAFIFVLQCSNNVKQTYNINTPKIYNVTNASNAIYNNNSYGPTFGGGHCIYISNNCNTNSNSYCNHSSKSNYFEGENSCDENGIVLAGAQKFLVSDYEVFSVE